MAAREWALARDAWEEITAYYPAFSKIPSKVLENYARAARLSGRADEGFAITGRYLAERGRNPSILREHAECASDLGLIADALDSYQEYISARPRPPASAFGRLATILAGNGQFDSALTTIGQGLRVHPGSELLTRTERSIRRDFDCPIPPVRGTSGETEHLFGYTRAGTSGAIAAATIRAEPVNEHVKAMLGFDQCYTADKNTPLEEVDVFVVWGSTNSSVHDMFRSYASRFDKPLLTMEYGFVSSLDIAAAESTQHSIIVCPGPIYYDSTQPNAPTSFLNSSADIDASAIMRASACIDLLRSTRVTKYNHAPILNMRERILDNGRPKILIVDQRKGDKSVTMGLADASTFKRMLDHALSLKDHDVVLKLHPDSISGKFGSYLSDLVHGVDSTRIIVVDYDVNPYSLFDVVDKVFVATSQLGFEALFAGLDVFCFGVPFYAGWGFTHDMVAMPRRLRARSIEEVFATYYFKYSRYYVPGSDSHELEDLVKYIIDNRPECHPRPLPAKAPAERHALRILMIVPSGRMGASGRYLQTLSEKLIALGNSVIILSEGSFSGTVNGVIWRPIEFDGIVMSARLRSQVERFAPEIVYVNGVRTRAQRIALEIVALTRARLVTQAEDDDVDVYAHRARHPDIEHLTLLDIPSVSMSDVKEFLSRNDWEHTIAVLSDPGLDRWVEPVLRMLTNRTAQAHTAIWRPFSERLAAEYGKPTMVVPPVAHPFDFDRKPADAIERRSILSRYGLDDDRVVFFLGGSVYSYSNEFHVFLRALAYLANRSESKIALVVAGRSPLPVARILSNHLPTSIQYVHLDSPSDGRFIELLRACDVCCSPGLETRFNKYRLPSRLVKAMAMGKPVLTCTTGFGESLKHGYNAALTTGNDPETWSTQMEILLSSEHRQSIGANGRDFARAHFEADIVAAALSDFFSDVLKSTTPSAPFGLGAVRSSSATSSSETVSLAALGDLISDGLISLDVVVQIGAGIGDELNDYIRLGARHVTFVEKDPDRARTLLPLSDVSGGSVVVRSVAATTDNRPARSGPAFEDLHVSTESIADALAPLENATSGLLVVYAQGDAVPLVRALRLEEYEGIKSVVVRTHSPHEHSADGASAVLVALLQQAGYSANVVGDPTNDRACFVVGKRLARDSVASLA